MEVLFEVFGRIWSSRYGLTLLRNFLLIQLDDRWMMRENTVFITIAEVSI